jgi:CDP-paratose synthetase
MKVLITGVTGFLGSHLARFLISNGHSVIGLKRRSSSKAKINSISHGLELLDVEDGYEFLSSDIDAIIHTATCYGNKGESISDILAANVIFPLALLEQAQLKGIRIFLNASTFFSKADENYGYLSTYIKSKNIFHEFAKNFCAANDLKLANLNIEHMYGPGDSDSKFIESIAKQLVENKKLIDFTTGEQVRDFIHVDDVVSAFEKILLYVNNNSEKKYFNFEVGTGIGTSVKNFVIAMHAISGSESMLNFGSLPYRKNEIMYSQANINELLATGWKSQISINDGINSVFVELLPCTKLL